MLDYDGDGLDDLLILKPSNGPNDTGHVVGRRLPVFGEGPQRDRRRVILAAADAAITFKVTGSSNWLYQAAVAGDVNADTKKDFLIVDSKTSVAASGNTGTAYLFLGGALTSGGTYDAADLGQLRLERPTAWPRRTAWAT